MATVSRNHGSQEAILSRLIRPQEQTLSEAAARAILQIEFDPRDRERMRELAAKNQEGVLTEKEQDELDNYLRIGRLVDLLCAKARLSLVRSGSTPE